MGSLTTKPTTSEVPKEWKVSPVAERAHIVGRAGEILRAKPEVRDDESVDFGRYRIFPRLRLLLRDGVKVDISTRAFDVLWVLVRADGELVSKDQLLDTVWSRVVVEENNLQVQMSAIRRALGADRGMIRTEFGRGYRLVAEKQKTPHSRAGTSEVKRSTPSSLPLPLTPCTDARRTNSKSSDRSKKAAASPLPAPKDLGKSESLSSLDGAWQNISRMVSIWQTWPRSWKTDCLAQPLREHHRFPAPTPIESTPYYRVDSFA
jgi:DNA-binding winged helix-turn-helix (wHTH) protein